jgi:hypothetical protein
MKTFNKYYNKKKNGIQEGELPLYVTAVLTAGLLSSSGPCGGKIFSLYAGHFFGPEPEGINAFKFVLVCMHTIEAGKYA